MHRFMIILSAALGALLLTACGSEPDSSSSSAGEVADETRAAAEELVEDTQATAEDMVQDANAALDEAGAAISDAADEAGDAAEQAMNDVEAAVDETMDDAQAAVDEAVDDVNAATADAMGAGAAGGATAAAAIGDDDPCTLGIEVGDNIAYSTDSLSAPASCDEVTLTITHTGQLPAIAMGHNWVLVAQDDMESVAQAGAAAGADAGYLPDDDRIIAATNLVGGGQSDSVSFSLDALQDGVTYSYVCTFPGHWMVMRGSFTVSG